MCEHVTVDARALAIALDAARADAANARGPGAVAMVEHGIRRYVEAVAPLGRDGPTSDAIDARRWRAVRPFLLIEQDDDGEGTWVDLTVSDSATGAGSVEITPAAGAQTADEFADTLAAHPERRVGSDHPFTPVRTVQGDAESQAGPWAILYEDADVKPEVFVGEGAESAARTRYAQARAGWTCHLLCSAREFQREFERRCARVDADYERLHPRPVAATPRPKEGLTPWEAQAIIGICVARQMRDETHRPRVAEECPTCRAAVVSLVHGGGEAMPVEGGMTDEDVTEVELRMHAATTRTEELFWRSILATYHRAQRTLVPASAEPWPEVRQEDVIDLSAKLSASRRQHRGISLSKALTKRILAVLTHAQQAQHARTGGEHG